MKRNKEFLIYFSVFLCGALIILTSFINAGIIGNLLIYSGIYALCLLLSKGYLRCENFNLPKLFTIDICTLSLVSFLYFLLFFINIALSLIFQSEAPNITFSVWLLIYTGLVVPITEEIFFRGCVCTGISAIYGKGSAVFISSLLFALLHSGTSGFIFAFIGGLMFSFLYMQTDSILPGLILHIANNFISVLALEFEVTVILAPITALLISFIFSVYCLLKKKAIIKKDLHINTDFLKSFNFYAAIIAIYILKIIGEKI